MSVFERMSAVRSTTKGVEPNLYLEYLNKELVAGAGFEPTTFGL